MKKLIGIFGVAAFAMTIFFNSNAISSSDSDFNLASLLTVNTANAEINCETSSYYDSGGVLHIVKDCENTNCVCKDGSCSEANWISFRVSCGDTSQYGHGGNTDENCAAQASPNSC